LKSAKRTHRNASSTRARPNWQNEWPMVLFTNAIKIPLSSVLKLHFQNKFETQNLKTIEVHQTLLLAQS